MSSIIINRFWLRHAHSRWASQANPNTFGGFKDFENKEIQNANTACENVIDVSFNIYKHKKKRKKSSLEHTRLLDTLKPTLFEKSNKAVVNRYMCFVLRVIISTTSKSINCNWWWWCTHDAIEFNQKHPHLHILKLNKLICYPISIGAGYDRYNARKVKHEAEQSWETLLTTVPVGLYVQRFKTLATQTESRRHMEVHWIQFIKSHGGCICLCAGCFDWFSSLQIFATINFHEICIV